MEITNYIIDVTVDTETGQVTGTCTEQVEQPVVTPPIVLPEEPPPVEPAPADPMVILTSEWSAIHDTARGVGHRRVEVVAGREVPAGHEIKLYSGTDPAATATAKSATVTPGTPYETKNPMAAGATCFNSLWWLKAADGTILPASENVISFKIE